MDLYLILVQHLIVGFGFWEIMIEEAISPICLVKLPIYVRSVQLMLWQQPRHPFLVGPNGWAAIYV